MSQRTLDGDKTYGNRVLNNTNDITKMFEKLKKEKKIDFDKIITFSSNMTMFEQACLVAKSSIFIGVHGNQLSWFVYFIFFHLFCIVYFFKKKL